MKKMKFLKWLLISGLIISFLFIFNYKQKSEDWIKNN